MPQCIELGYVLFLLVWQSKILGEKRFLAALRSRVQSVIVGKSRQQKLKAIGLYCIHNQEADNSERMLVFSSLLLFAIVWEPSQ